jgi:hypothetical protein
MFVRREEGRKGMEKIRSYISAPTPLSLVDLLLFVNTKLAGTHVDEEKETATGKGFVSFRGFTLAGKGGKLTQWIEFERSRIWRSPCVGDVGGAVCGS